MTQIKFIKDEDGNIISPVTNFKSVMADSGMVLNTAINYCTGVLLGQWDGDACLSAYEFNSSGRIPASLCTGFIIDYVLYSIDTGAITQKIGREMVQPPHITGSNFSISYRWWVWENLWETAEEFKLDINNDRLICNNKRPNINKFRINVYQIWGIPDIELMM